MVSPCRGETTEQKAADYLNTEHELSAVDAAHTDDSAEKWRDAIRRWHEVNATRLAKQLKVAEELRSSTNVANEVAEDSTVFPENIPAEVRQMLVRQAAVETAMKRIRQRESKSSPDQLRAAIRGWLEQNAAEVSAVSNALERAARKSEQDLPEPPPISSPPDVAPAVADLLRQQAEIDGELRALRRSYAGADPSKARDAVLAWHERNSARLKKLSALQNEIERLSR